MRVCNCLANLMLLVLFAAPPVMAEETAAAATLRAQLSGNTVAGASGPRTYRQYFDPAGGTTYVEQGRVPSRGTWRVTEDGQYCSVWGEAESCYGVELDTDAGTLVWIGSDGTRWPPARILPGNQLRP